MSFEERLKSSVLPVSGPTYYAARRDLWLSPIGDPRQQVEPSATHRRLERLLSQPDAVYDDQVWKSGVEKAWKGLEAGSKLRQSLPLALVVKVIHSAWLRDPETWPSGAVAPESDEAPKEPVICISPGMTADEKRASSLAVPVER